MSLLRQMLCVAIAVGGLNGVGAAQGAREPLGVPVGEAEAGGGEGALHLEVRLEERRLYVFRGTSEVASYPVAVGKPEHPTPQGEFRIRKIVWNPAWVPPAVGWARGRKPKAPGDPDNPMGRVKMFFQEPDYYIHGTNQEESLGRAESHGCVRMANDDVVELARLVMEHGGEPREPTWFERVLSRLRRSQTVRLSEPVRVVIR